MPSQCSRFNLLSSFIRFSQSKQNRHGALIFILIAMSGVMSACTQPPKYGYIQGETMGTSYHIRYQLPKQNQHNAQDANSIKKTIDQRLEQVNASMSTYQTNSLISQFNRLPAHTPMAIDADFIHVLTDSRQVYQASQGAFDPTVLPLIELWGFGASMRIDRLQNPPSSADIAHAKNLLNFDAITLNHNQLSKNQAGVSLDFSAIAKGYGVDVIANVLANEYHIDNYMVEIGGEVATSGINEQGQGWQIGIDAPILHSGVSDRQTLAAIKQPVNENKQGNLHLATSGNYRNSVVFDDIRYSHTIDPKTGKPIVGGASSVTVVDKSVALADGWATALTAMPYDKAWQMANEQGLAVLFVIPKASSDINANSHQPDDWQITQTPVMQALRAGK